MKLWTLQNFRQYTGVYRRSTLAENGCGCFCIKIFQQTLNYSLPLRRLWHYPEFHLRGLISSKESFQRYFPPAVNTWVFTRGKRNFSYFSARVKLKSKVSLLSDHSLRRHQIIRSKSKSKWIPYYYSSHHHFQMMRKLSTRAFRNNGRDVFLYSLCVFL